MIIGWCRLTMMMEIDLNKTDKGFAGMRTGYMKALVRAGHTIKILSPMGKDSRESYNFIKKGGKPEELGEWDTSWFESVTYAPKKDASDCDLLIVESSACNWMFKWQGQPLIRRCAEILDSYSGTVIIEQSDPELPFPFGKLGCAKRKYSHSKNPYRLGEESGHKELELYGWADPKEIWDNKTYFVATRALDEEAIKDIGMYNGIRFQYKKLAEEDKITILHMPQAYDFESHNEGVEYNHEPTIDITYAGYPRTDQRERKFVELFLGLDNSVDKAVCGPWNKTSREELRTDLDYNYVEYRGNLSWHDLPRFLNESKFTLYLGVSKAYRLNWQTNKPFEAISSGSVLLFDEGIKYLEDWLGAEFIIGEHNLDLWSFIIKNIDNEDRKALWEWQHSQISFMTWDYYLQELGNATNESTHSDTDIENSRSEVPQEIKDILERYSAGYSEYQNSVVRWQDQWHDVVQNKIEAGNNYIRENYSPPACFREYEQGEDVCEACVFKAQCIAAMQPNDSEIVPEEPEEEQGVVPASTFVTDSDKIIKPEEEKFTEPSGEENITITKERSCIVIHIKNAKDLSLHLHI